MPLCTFMKMAILALICKLAKLFGADEQDVQEAMLEKTLANPRLVSVEAISVEVSETGTVWANRLREQIRANGPTVGWF